MLRLQCLLRPTVWLYAWLSWQLLGNVLVRQQSVTLRMLTAVAVACLSFETVRLLNDKLRRHLCHILAGYATVVACAGWLQAEGGWEDLLPSNPGVWGAWAGIGFLVVVTQLNRQQGSKVFEGLWGLSLLALLIASHSRASWLGTLAGLLAWLAGGGQLVRFVKGRRWLVLPVLLGGILCGIGLYQFKPDSAKGRWLIWKADMPLVQESPLTGLGADAFRRQYHYAQSDYFRQHPGTPEALYADNVVYAYNEPFKVLIEQGLIGLLLSVGLFLSCLLRRRQTSADRLWRSLLLLWGVYGLFAYPSNVASLYVLFFLLVGALSDGVTGPVARPRYVRMAVCLAAVAVIGWGTVRYLDLRQRLQTETLEKDDHDALKTYPDLYEEYILRCYEHAPESPRTLNVLEEAAGYFPGSVLFCYLGDCYQVHGRYKQAEAAYLQARMILPCRFLPRYKLFDLYRQEGLEQQAAAEGRAILQLPVKVENTLVFRIRGEVKRYLNSIQQPQQP